MSRSSKLAKKTAAQQTSGSRFAVLGNDDASDSSPSAVQDEEDDEEAEIARAIALVEEYERKERGESARTGQSKQRQRTNNGNRLQGGVGKGKTPESPSSKSKRKEKGQMNSEEGLGEAAGNLDWRIGTILSILPEADPQRVHAVLLEKNLDLEAAIDALTLDGGGSGLILSLDAKKAGADEVDEHGWPVLDDNFLESTLKDARSFAQRTEETFYDKLEVFVTDDDIVLDDGTYDLDPEETASNSSVPTEDIEWEHQLESSFYDAPALDFLTDVIPDAPRTLIHELCLRFPDVEGSDLFDWLVAIQDQAGKGQSWADVISGALCQGECREKKGGEKACLLHSAERLLRKLKRREKMVKEQEEMLLRLRKAEEERKQAWKEPVERSDEGVYGAKPRAGTKDSLDGFVTQVGKKKVVLIPEGKTNGRARDGSTVSGRTISTSGAANRPPPSNADLWQYYRQKALDCHLKSQQLYRLASQSSAKRDLTGRGTAMHYAEQGHEARREMQRWNDKAAAELIARTQGRNILDLHYLFQKEAVAAVAERLEDFYRGWTYGRSRNSHRQFKIITGRGLHSVDQVSKIHPVVCNYLRKEGWRFQPMSGTIVVFGPPE
jgi:hypothetical protein